MGTLAGIGFSKNLDGAQAALEAAEQAKEQLGQDIIDIALIFSSAHYDPQEFLPAAYEALDHTKIIGTSTAGIILPDRIETKGISVVAISSDNIRFETSHVNHLKLQNAYQAGQKLAKNSLTDFGQKERKIFTFFADGLLNDTSSMIDGIKNVLGPSFPIIGAGSSDDFRFTKTYQYYNNEFMTQGACGVLFGGRIKFGAGCQHGWRPLGKPRTIDKVEGHIIKTIDGKKAISLYEEYFDEKAEDIKRNSLGQINTRYPLGIKTANKKDYLLRNVLNILDDGSIVCQDKIPEGCEVHLMIGNTDSCLKAAQTAATQAKEQLTEFNTGLVIIIESIARYKIMGRAALQEIQIIKDVFGSIPTIGMYSFGEIYSINQSSETQFKNGSVVVLAIN